MGEPDSCQCSNRAGDYRRWESGDYQQEQNSPASKKPRLLVEGHGGSPRIYYAQGRGNHSDVNSLPRLVILVARSLPVGRFDRIATNSVRISLHGA